MSRTHAQAQAFRVAQIQQKRADRADERLAEVRRELSQARRECQMVAADNAHLKRCRNELRESLGAAIDRELTMREQVRKTFADLREIRERANRPLWRIAAQRFGAWLREHCR